MSHDNVDNGHQKRAPTNSDASMSVPIIGYHRSPLSQKFGIPRQPNLVAVPSYIEMVPPYNTLDAFAGIEGFSHLWITWQAHHNYQHNLQRNHQNNPQHSHQNVERSQLTNQGLGLDDRINQEQTVNPVQSKSNTFKPKVRPPRLGGNAKLGVFATRSTYRPSQIGLSVVELIGIETVDSDRPNADGKVRVNIVGADMVDGTPIIDIKPYLAYSDTIVDANSGFAPQPPQPKLVEIANMAEQHLQAFAITSVDISIMKGLIAQDPRPAYRQSDTTRIYIMRYKEYDIHFRLLDNNSQPQTLQIVAVTAVVPPN